MKEQQLFYDLALWRIPGIGPRTFKFLKEKIIDTSLIFKISDTELQKLGIAEQLIAAFKQVSWRHVELDLQWRSQKSNRYILTFDQASYPNQLAEISSAPSILFVEGDVLRLNHKQIAMVGSRNASQLGRQIARQFASSLAQHNIVITSGLAYGIDKAAHEGALETKTGTIAVLGAGLDRIYPSAHSELAQKIIENGALVSEFPIGTRSQKPLIFHAVIA